LPDGVIRWQRVSFTNADGLKLGILHAQKGVWNARRLLAEQWVEQATRARARLNMLSLGGRDGYYAALWPVRADDPGLSGGPMPCSRSNGAMEESSVLWPPSKSIFPGRLCRRRRRGRRKWR